MRKRERVCERVRIIYIYREREMDRHREREREREKEEMCERDMKFSVNVKLFLFV